MMTTMATNCSSTRSRISFCERLGEPPRIMLTSPNTSTTATAMIAAGTAKCDIKSDNWRLVGAAEGRVLAPQVSRRHRAPG